MRSKVPAINDPIENAAQVRNKPGHTLNRAGSSPRNPILNGLADDIIFDLSSRDTIRNLYIYRDGRALGANLRAQAFEGPIGSFVIRVVHGLGQTVTGDTLTGAVKNFIRAETSRGVIEREFYIKDLDFDDVALDGKPAIDPASLPLVPPAVSPDPLQIDVVQLDPSLTWLDVGIDFFVSKGDEFQVLHNKKNPFLDPGFLKSYAGAAFVSLFDGPPGSEGVGVQFNPFTESPIKDQHKIQVQNTLGIKNGVVRFRAKQGSPWFRDVPIRVNVITIPCSPSDPPTDGGNGAPPPAPPDVTFFPDDRIIPPGETDTPDNASPENGDPTLAGIPGNKINGDLLIITLQAAAFAASSTLKVMVRKYVAVIDLTTQTYAGTRWVIQDRFDLTPLIVPGATVPAPPPGYQPAVALRVAFNAKTDKIAGVVAYSLQVKDGTLLGEATVLEGPAVRTLGSHIKIGLGASAQPPPV